MINGVTMKILADDYILRALQEDVTSEDVTTNAVMPMPTSFIYLTTFSNAERLFSGSPSSSI